MIIANDGCHFDSGSFNLQFVPIRHSKPLKSSRAKFTVWARFSRMLAESYKALASMESCFKMDPLTKLKTSGKILVVNLVRNRSNKAG